MPEHQGRMTQFHLLELEDGGERLKIYDLDPGGNHLEEDLNSSQQIHDYFGVMKD